MTELNVIIPYCCITGKYCSYNNGFVDGYMIGMATILLVVTIISSISVWYEVCKGKTSVESDNEEEVEKVDKKTEEVEKSEEDKKVD